MSDSKASKFDSIEQSSPIEVFALVAAFRGDQHPDKVNLSVGAYRNNEAKPWVLPVVSTAEAQMANDKTLNHEYLPVAGLQDYRDAAGKLLLGADSPCITTNRVGCVQACGGTGALRIAAEFLKKKLDFDTVYVSNPTWGNHKTIFKAAGFSQVKEYRYWDAASKGLDFKGMMEDLGNAPPKSVAILHAVAHNPTGVDPSREQWKEIADLCREKDLFVILDCAYQGFATGDLEKDAAVPRFFAEEGFEFFVAQSFSKNFGLYNERVGNLCVICKNPDVKTRVLSQLEIIVRCMWSNPPNHGARVVATVLNNPALCSEWRLNVKLMADRILEMRDLLFNKLKSIGCPGNWDHVIKQRGMFSYTGLNEQQSDMMVKKYHIYVMKSGRINMCGLTTGNIDYVANAIKSVITDCKGQGQHSNM